MGEMDNYLQTYNLPKLNLEEVECLNRTLTASDIETVIKKLPALAGVAQWIEHSPANQRVTGSIPSQGTYLGYMPGPQ